MRTRARWRRLGARLVLLGALSLGATVRADAGAWLWLEYRLPVWERPPRVPRLSLRLFTDTRFTDRAGGFAQQFLRVGPLFEPTPWLALAIHGTAFAGRGPDGSFEQEARLEVEPTFQATVGALTIADRNRLELRWREARTRVRYRNGIRVTYQVPRTRWLPFVWNEFLVDLSDGYNENRLMPGVGVRLNDHVRLDVGYLLRSRRVGEVWEHDHFGVVSLFVGVPPRRR